MLQSPGATFDGTPYPGGDGDRSGSGRLEHSRFPAGCCTTSQDILNQTRAALGSEEAQVNVFVKGQIRQILQKPPVNLNPAQPSALLNRVSISFSSIMFPNKHTWPLSNTNDGTIMMTVQPTLGFPRGW